MGKGDNRVGAGQPLSTGQVAGTISGPAGPTLRPPENLDVPRGTAQSSAESSSTQATATAAAAGPVPGREETPRPGACACPKCKSFNNTVKNGTRTRVQGVMRYRKCVCGYVFSTMQKHGTLTEIVT